jgi:5-methylcytosine-specific restriction enzyme subunit McrC
VATRITQFQPDLLFQDDNVPVLVGDCKYKRATQQAGSDSDLYQMVAYCTALGLDHGVLIYPRHLDDIGDETIRKSPIRIHRVSVDLGVPLAHLRGEWARLAQRLVAAAGFTTMEARLASQVIGVASP